MHPATKRKLEKNMTNCSSDPPSLMPDQEFVELLWENGQIVVQGQSIKHRKSPPPSVLPSSHITKAPEKDCRDAIMTRIGKYGATADTVPNEFVAAGPSGQTGLCSHDDEMVPWLSYPVDDYCSEFLFEFPGVNMNSLATHNTALPVPVPVDRSSVFGQAGRYSHILESESASRMGGFEPLKTRNSQMYQLPQAFNSFAPNNRLRGMDFSTGNGTGTSYGRPCENFPETVMQDRDLVSSKPLEPSSSAKLMNFSHFSRPVALVKANLQNVERLRSYEKACTATAGIPMGSAVIESPRGINGGSGILGQSASITTNAESIRSVQPPHVAVSVDHLEPICQENGSRKDKVYITNDEMVPDHKDKSVCFTAIMTIEKQETEKGPEPALAPSSVCSGNGGAGAAYDDPKQRPKRKSQEDEESGYPSEDVEDESVGVKKPANGRGMSAKRSRAAEVHNLSERRRRDRINEKMRALQELIPNCNKTDKASMLDEAIEYLKTLQLQVQIMSMGSGLCMPPMMLPAGMQHIRAPHMAHFSPMGAGMGLGMGMGLGFGMGMLDMNGCPLIPMPPMHGPHFHCSSIPGNPGLQGMPTSAGVQVFGIPGQGLPMSMPPRRPPFVPVSGLPSKVNSEQGISGASAGVVPAEDSAPTTLKDQQMLTVEKATKTHVDGSQIQRREQEIKECEQSTLLQISHQASNFSGNGAIISVNGYGTSSSGPTFS